MGLLPFFLLAGLFIFIIAISIYDRRKKARSSIQQSAGVAAEPVTSMHPRRPSSSYDAAQGASGGPISPLSVFHSKPPLTAREATCYWSLTKNLNGHYIVLPQVAFSAFLFVEGGDTRSNFRRFATMRQKVADFLIVRPDFSIIALIELDDRSHENKQEADRQRDAAIKQAGIRVFRIPQVPHSDQVQRLCDVLLKLDMQR